MTLMSMKRIVQDLDFDWLSCVKKKKNYLLAFVIVAVCVFYIILPDTCSKHFIKQSKSDFIMFVIVTLYSYALESSVHVKPAQTT